MAFIVKIGLTPKMRKIGLRINEIRNNTPSVPEQPDQPCSLVKLDMDAYKWQVLMEPDGFRRLYGATQGNIARGLGEGADVTLLHPTSPDMQLLTLLSMTFTARAKVKGKVVANFTQGTGQPEIYTYFWRELEYPEMTAMERMQEVIQICCQSYLQGQAREEFGNLASVGNLAMVAGTMLFFLAPVGIAINAIRAVVGYLLLGSSLQVDYEFYKARIIDIQYACTKPNVTKNEMNAAGKSLAEILTKIMADLAMAKLGHALSQGANWIMERGRLSRLFTGKTKQEWEEAGRKEERQPHSNEHENVARVVNQEWISEVKPSDLEGIGMLEGEMKAFRSLANKGYYVVCRSCNSARLKWLRKHIAINGKPLWIKTKSLKGLKNAFYEGLTGMRKDGRDTIYSLDHLEPVTNLPSNFKIEFMEKGKTGKVYKLKAGKQMDEISGHENEIYFVDVGEAYVIVDNKGRAYIPDLDVVLFQKKLPSGGYAPPGMNTALGKTPEGYSGGDNAMIEADFNSFFKRYCHYPEGYEPVQHGGGAGTAGYLKKNKEITTVSNPRKPGWSPIRPTEGECVVAVQGLPGEVGIARTWHDVAAFHKANPFGEWRW